MSAMDRKTSDVKAVEKQDSSAKVPTSMQKRKIVKEDGRTLIFYSFTDSNGQKQDKN